MWPHLLRSPLPSPGLRHQSLHIHPNTQTQIQTHTCGHFQRKTGGGRRRFCLCSLESHFTRRRVQISTLRAKIDCATRRHILWNLETPKQHLLWFQVSFCGTRKPLWLIHSLFLPKSSHSCSKSRGPRRHPHWSQEMGVIQLWFLLCFHLRDHRILGSDCLLLPTL